MKKIILILGAKSDIAIATVHQFANKGYSIQLASRQSDNLISFANEIKKKYLVPVDLFEFDVLDTNTHGNFISSLPEIPEIVLCAVGLLGIQEKSEKNISDLILILKTNFEGPASILSLFANMFEKLGRGTIIGISSVAGDRGKVSNYIYGSAKSGFTAFLSGLRNRLSSKGVKVITVIPGPVRTKMTQNSKLPYFITAEVGDVSKSIYMAVKKNRDIIYVKPIWKLIMCIVKIIPELIFKKLKL
jgi:short-subunit dehydrogenase